MIDYSKNWALNQEKIRKGRVTIVGANALTNYLCFYMAGLGLRNIRLIDDGKVKFKEEFLINRNKSKVSALEDKLKEVNDDLIIEAIPLPLDESFIGYPDVLLDLSNNPKTKEICSDYFYKKKEIKLFVSASSSKTSATAIFRKEKNRVLRKFADNSLVEFSDQRQGAFTSGLIAAIILDEIRKIVSPLDGDSYLTGKVNYNQYLKNRFSFGSMIPQQKEDKIRGSALVCGVGGIGTYVALNLALEGVRIDICDGDIIEQHNVARQIFYHDSIGMNKAYVLMSKLVKITENANIRACTEYLTANNVMNLPKYDVVICCADNWEARLLLNNYALESDTPLINASVTAFTASAEAYLPGINYCLECKYDFSKLLGKRRQGCAELNESNVVMTNAFIGALAAAEVKSVIRSKTSFLENNFEYHSKKGKKRKFNIRTRKAIGNRKCKCHM